MLLKQVSGSREYNDFLCMVHQNIEPGMGWDAPARGELPESVYSGGDQEVSRFSTVSRSLESSVFVERVLLSKACPS